MAVTKKKKLMIIDGNALIHRSFHAIPPTMATKDGEPTNAVFGFTTVLLKALREFKPEYIVLTLDKKAPTFRHIKFKEYKATRTKAPDELYSQIPKVKEVAQAFNIPIFEKSGFEADDLIGTIATIVKDDIEKIIVTGDKDTFQLINDSTKVYTMSRGMSESVIYTDKEVKDKFDGLGPDQMTDYKALSGDSSDNIPGVRGIGDKMAKNLLKEFKSLDGVYENINSDKIKDRTRDLLLGQKKEAYLSYELATIKLDVDIKFDLESASTKDFDQDEVIDLFSKLEFKSLLNRAKDLRGDFKDDKKENKGEDKFNRNKKEFKYVLVDSDKKFEKFLQELKKQKEFTFDTETSGFDPLLEDILGISFSWKKGEAYYLLLKSSKDNGGNNLFSYRDKTRKIHPWLVLLKPIFENSNIKKIAHNAKFDMRVIQNEGVDVKGVYFDTMLASYLLNPGSRQHNLDAVVFSEFGFEKINKDDLLGTGKNKITFSQVPDDKMYLYSCEDADFTNRLVSILKKELKEKQAVSLFEDIEMPLIPVLAKVENNGVLLDRKVLDELGKKVDKKIKNLEQKIYKLAGTKFNINSTKQMKEILFEKLDISTLSIAKTKTGFSTAASELEKMKYEHEIIPPILEYRELNKLATTYINSLPELINPRTKRIHTSFNQTIASTGRLSSTNPNLQNIPIKTELGTEIRRSFVASPGYKLLGLDYSQIELRLAAHLSGDKKMIATFKEGVDIHTSTAAAINDVGEDKVTKEMRREAKAINFGILYGQGPFGLSQTADIPFARAKEFIDQYFNVYKGVKKYIENSIKEAGQLGYVETLFGRRRYLPEINSAVAMVKKQGERFAINAPLQGTNADMIKKAMIEVQALIDKKYGDDARMIIQVHDELVFEVKTDIARQIAEEIKGIMVNIIKLKVPIVVDVAIGDNWGEI